MHVHFGILPSWMIIYMRCIYSFRLFLMCLLCCWSVLRSNCSHLCFAFLRAQCHSCCSIWVFVSISTTFFRHSLLLLNHNLWWVLRVTWCYLLHSPNNLFFKHGNNSFHCTRIRRWCDFLITFKSLLWIVFFSFENKNDGHSFCHMGKVHRNDKLNIQRPTERFVHSFISEREKKRNISLARASFQSEKYAEKKLLQFIIEHGNRCVLCETGRKINNRDYDCKWASCCNKTQIH